MRKSLSLFFKSFHEFVSRDKVKNLPKGMRGLYVLYQEDDAGFLNLMYVGMTDAGAKGRIDIHSKSESKAQLWTHCSVLEVWDNITKEQIAELEALFRHTLRRDATANPLGIQRGSGIFSKLANKTKKGQVERAV